MTRGQWKNYIKLTVENHKILILIVFPPFQCWKNCFTVMSKLWFGHTRLLIKRNIHLDIFTQRHIIDKFAVFIAINTVIIIPRPVFFGSQKRIIGYRHTATLAYFRHFYPFLHMNYTIFSRQKHKKSRQMPVFLFYLIVCLFLLGCPLYSWVLRPARLYQSRRSEAKTDGSGRGNSAVALLSHCPTPQLRKFALCATGILPSAYLLVWTPLLVGSASLYQK